MRRLTGAGGALAAYLAVSIVYFGVPLTAHPGRDLLGTGTDPEIFIWSLGWWPHAVLHGLNPFVTHVVWAPRGVDLAWVTSVPGLSLLAAPLTLIAGATIAYNVVGVVLPALAAWTCFLLCRHLTHAFWPSLAGGYLFGFSSYMLGQTQGHLNLYSVFLVPLVALLVVRFVEGTLSRRRFVLLLGPMLAFQVAFSTEVALTLTLTLAVSLLAAAATFSARRGRIVALLPPLAGAYVLGGVLASPLIAYALLHFQSAVINPPALYPADLLNLVVPTRNAWIGWSWTEHISDSFAGNIGENGAYLGLPCLAVLGSLAWTKRREPAARFLMTMLALAIAAELGTALHVEGRRVIWLPWHALAQLRVFDNVLPVRFALYVSLAASVGVAWWAASSAAPRWLRIALPLAAVVTIVPHLWLAVWHEHPVRLAFFTDGEYRACLTSRDNVVMLPFPKWDDAMLWQAEAGYAFSMANGHLSSLNPPDATDPGSLEANEPGPDARLLLQWAHAQHATLFLVDGMQSAPWMAALGSLKDAEIGGVYLYAVPGHSSPCL